MREGFAIFFSGLTSAGGGRPVFRENLGWLQTVKTMRDRPRPGDILLAEDGGADFKALAWSLVSFFLNSGKETYARSLAESFMVLRDSAPAAENAGAVMRRIALGSDMDSLDRDYQGYLDSRKTFAELVDEGETAYAGKDREGAELAFRAALNQKPDHYAPHYYLGLLAYDSGDHAAAAEYYFASMGYGADLALIFYALGLNAAAAGSAADAVDFLGQAAEIAPDRFREKAGKLIPRLQVAR
jgi:hypothetical protein